MIMIIFIHKKDTLQIMATNIQHSPNLRMPVQIEYIELRMKIVVAGTSIDRQHRLNHIRNTMQNRCREECQKAWNSIIEKIDLERDPKRFWGDIKKLQGNEGKTTAKYIKDSQGNKIYEDREKEVEFRKYWDIFF